MEGRSLIRDMSVWRDSRAWTQVGRQRCLDEGSMEKYWNGDGDEGDVKRDWLGAQPPRGGSTSDGAPAKFAWIFKWCWDQSVW